MLRYERTERVNISQNIIIYGVGKRGRSLVELMDICGVHIGHIIDSNRELWGMEVGKHIVETPDVLMSEKNPEICITVGSFLGIADIRKKLMQICQFDISNEVSYHSLIMYLYQKIDMKSLIKKKQTHERDGISVIFGCESGLGLGGIEEWTKSICAKFVKEREYESYILVGNSADSIPKELNNHILQADIDSGQMFSLHNVEQIVNCIIPYLPCIIVSSQPDQTLLAGKILKDMFGERVKVISGIRGGHAEINDSYMDMRACTDLYVCVNSTVREDMIKRGVSVDKVYTMLCPVECPAVLKRSYSLDSNRPLRIGFAGRLEKEEKRMDLMLRVIELLEERRLSYCLTFAGAGSYQETIEMFIEKHACYDRVKLLGKIDKKAIWNFWQEQDVCVNISDHEGRSRSTIEAMANGAVPVVTDTWGVKDDIKDGENGFIVNVRDYRAMAEKLCFLGKNRDMLPLMGKNAHKELMRKSSMDDHYRFWQEIIDLVMGETK